jgi:CRISPR-associated exonuclease Cas4
VASYRLGLAGVCDVVEFKQSNQGVHLPGREGMYQPAPVEYKRGKPKRDPIDEAQLCAQAMCLEEMLSVSISSAWLYYGEIRRRVAVDLTLELRSLVEKMAGEMHAYYRRGYTPRVKTSRACRSCSLADLCLPYLQEKTIAASQYIRQQIERD